MASWCGTLLKTLPLKSLLILGVFMQFGLQVVATESAIYSVTVQDSEKVPVKQGRIVLEEGKQGTVEVVGRSLCEGQTVVFTWLEGEPGSECNTAVGGIEYPLTDLKKRDNEGLFQAVLTFKLPETIATIYYICLEPANSANCQTTTTLAPTNDTTIAVIPKNVTDSQVPASRSWFHQGTFIKFESKTPLLPLWLQIIMIVLFLALSGLFSGLNLGLMSLDPTELKIIQNSGSESEKKCAKLIQPVRKHGNFLLCTLLLGNVMVNSSLTILLDDIGGGVIAVVASTVGIVIFGEIVPQAICSRHGLAVGARTIWITKVFMVLTFPISFPMSKLLDCVLGEELGQVYNREKLTELIKLGTDKEDIQHDEINMMDGVLQLKSKTAEQVMTPIDDAYMVDYNSILDFETITDIMNNGYTRVPVYEKNRYNIVALLNIKDLAFVDPDDRTPLKTVCKFYNHPITFVFEDTKLDQLLDEFKKGQSHMAFVQKIVNNGDSDPYYQVLGIVTLEDIIEEIIQAEILDETDVVTDNRTKSRRHNMRKKDFSVFNEPDEAGRKVMSPQLVLVCFQYLQTHVDPFKEDLISSGILKRLLKKDIYVEYQLDEKSIDTLLYIASKPADYFVLILQGRCSVEIGKDNMKFEAGPFQFFGIESLTAGASKDLRSNSASNISDIVYSKKDVYIPDFTVRALTNLEYVKIKRHQYLAARRATLMERQLDASSSTLTTDGDAFNAEWLKAQLMNTQQPNTEEGMPPLYNRLHQRNFSSGNLTELRNRIDMPPLKPSPLVGSSTVLTNGPQRTIIYPQPKFIRGQSVEESKRLIDNSHTNT